MNTIRTETVAGNGFADSFDGKAFTSQSSRLRACLRRARTPLPPTGCTAEPSWRAATGDGRRKSSSGLATPVQVAETDADGDILCDVPFHVDEGMVSIRGETRGVSPRARLMTMATTAGREAEERIERAGAVAARIVRNVETVVEGKDEQVRLVLAAFAGRGHVLLEDVPGTAKTVLARSLAGSIDGATVSRIQCTPDLQPTDVTGLSVWDPSTRRFEFQPGPVFANVLLVDEINRALPKAQSALLEGMAEGQVTVDGVTHPLPDPFLVIATENTIEQEGTFPLPEAQLDRFVLRTSLGYPTLDEELSIVGAQLHGHPLERLQPVVAIEELGLVFGAVEDVYIDPQLKRWALELVRATRESPSVEVGASVRGSLALDRMARAWALVNGRSYVVVEDVERLLGPVVGHRLVLSADALLSVDRDERDIVDDVLAACLERIPPPEPDWEPEPEAGPSQG
jgi:MoxR-like ATPase